MERYFDIAFSSAARQHQERRGSYERYSAAGSWDPPAGLGDDEIEFIGRRDSIYLASVGQDGWPYVQHRGGPAGFVHVIDATHLTWLDRPGNQQYVSAGNIEIDQRVAIIAMDYPNRRRLKLYGHATFTPEPSPEQLELVGSDGRFEGVVTIEVAAFDWNCPKYITPRYTADEVRAATEPLHEQISELRGELAAALGR